MKTFAIIGACAVLGLLSGCNPTQSYRMATSSKSASYLEVGTELARVLAHDPGMRIEVVSSDTMGSDVNLRLLANGEVHFALAQGDTRLHGQPGASDQGQERIKTVLPLYPEILFIIYPDTLQAASLAQLVRGRRVGLGPQHGGTASFMRRLFQHYGIEEGAYTPVYTPYSENVVSDRIDVSCALTGYNNARINQMLLSPGLRLFSLGDPALAFKGSSVDGFCLTHGPARPFVIPIATYRSQPEQPVLTVAVDATLLASEAADDYAVYNMVEAIFANKQYLAGQHQLFSGLSEHFDYNSLSYPLHEGARMYLERDKPSFAERHGKLLGSVLLAIVTGIPMVYRWHQQRKKDRIDRFYGQLLQLEDRLEVLASSEELHACERELKQIRDAAYQGLVEERLDANPSFRIFTDLLHEVRGLLELRRKDFG